MNVVRESDQRRITRAAFLKQASALVGGGFSLLALGGLTSGCVDRQRAALDQVRQLDHEAYTSSDSDVLRCAAKILKPDGQINQEKVTSHSGSALCVCYQEMRTGWVLLNDSRDSIFTGDGKAQASSLLKTLQQHTKLLADAQKKDQLSPFQEEALRALGRRLEFAQEQLDLITAAANPDSERAKGVQRECTRTLRTIARFELLMLNQGWRR